jgi:hypothetical protein
MHTPKEEMNFRNPHLKTMWKAFCAYHAEAEKNQGVLENGEGVFTMFMDKEGASIASVGALNPNQVRTLALQLHEWSERILRSAIAAIKSGDFRRVDESGEAK